MPRFLFLALGDLRQQVVLFFLTTDLTILMPHIGLFSFLFLDSIQPSDVSVD
jgi:hypothetical protein